MIWLRSPLASLMPDDVGMLGQPERGGGPQIDGGAAGDVVEADRRGGRVGDGDEVAEQAFLGGLVVVGRGAEDVVDARGCTCAGFRRPRGAVSLLVAPAMTGTRPPATSTTAATTRSRSRVVQGLRLAGRAAGHQEVDPFGDLPVDQRAQSARKSTAPSSVNGVTSAVPHPSKPCHPLVSEQHVLEGEDAASARQPLRRRERAGREALAAPGHVRQRDASRTARRRRRVCVPGDGAGPHRGDREGRARDPPRAAVAWSTRAVPDGASSLAAWCSSRIEASNSGRPAKRRGQVARGAEKEVHADGEVGGVEQRAASGPHQRARSAASSACHPVVPVTVGMPGLDQPLEVRRPRRRAG